MIGVTVAGRPGAFRVNPHHADEVSGAVSRPSRVRDGQDGLRGEALPLDKPLDRIPVSSDNGCNVAR